MLPPEVVDICQPCELIVEPLTVGAVDLMNHREHNAAGGVEIAAIVGLVAAHYQPHLLKQENRKLHLEITAIVSISFA
jgi:hypothetical protein